MKLGLTESTFSSSEIQTVTLQSFFPQLLYVLNFILFPNARLYDVNSRHESRVKSQTTLQLLTMSLPQSLPGFNEMK